MTTRCTATRRDGSPCRAPALEGDPLCWAHAPRMAEARRAARSAGGRGHGKLSRPLAALPPELSEIFEALRDLFGEVRRGEARARDAEVAGALAGRLLDLTKFSYEVGEAKALERRLVALEAQLGGQQRRVGW